MELSVSYHGTAAFSSPVFCLDRLNARRYNPEGLPYPGAKPQKILDVEDRALTAQVLEILERVTPVSRRRAQKTCGTL